MSLYNTLEIDANSSLQEIKKSYRRLARIYHPDKCIEKNAVKKFQEISYAYEILSNDRSRKEYNSMNLKEKNKFESLLEKIFKNKLNLNELSSFGIKLSNEDMKYLDTNFYDLLTKLNLNEFIKFFNDNIFPKDKKKQFTLCSDSEIDIWDTETSESYYELPMQYHKFNKNDINLEFNITLKDIIKKNIKKIKINRNIYKKSTTTTFVFNIEKPYIIFYGGGDIDEDNGNLIIKLNLPDQYEWNLDAISYNYKMSLYKLIYGMDINMDIDSKKIRLKWNPSRDGYILKLKDIKIGEYNFQIKFYLEYDHTENKEIILKEYFN